MRMFPANKKRSQNFGYCSGCSSVMLIERSSQNCITEKELFRLFFVHGETNINNINRL